MPLYVRDDEADKLAKQYQELMGLKSKTAAVKHALSAGIKREQSDVSIVDQLKELRQRTAALGERDPNFNMKTFSDELWADE